MSAGDEADVEMGKTGMKSTFRLLFGAVAAIVASLGAASAKLQGMLTDADWSEALAASTRRPVSRRAPPRQARAGTRKAAPKAKP